MEDERDVISEKIKNIITETTNYKDYDNITSLQKSVVFFFDIR